MDSGLLVVRRSNHSAKSHPLSYTWTGHHGLTEQDFGSNRSAFPESSKPGLPGSETAGLLGF